VECTLDTHSGGKGNLLSYKVPQGWLQLGEDPSLLEKAVLTLNKNVIRKVYCRKVFKRKKKQLSHTPTPVFGSPPLDFDLPDKDLNLPLVSLKRKPTPVSEVNLRRSKRAYETQIRAHKKPPRQKTKAGKISNAQPTLPVFPDIAAIDKIMNMGLTYPAVSMKEIQKVAVEDCGVHPSEVTDELLQVAGSNKHMMLVTHDEQ
jgi:hypothetical protein